MVFRGWNYKNVFNNHEKVAKKRKEILKHYFWLETMVLSTNTGEVIDEIYECFIDKKDDID